MIDDQSEIHETFARIFQSQRSEDQDLNDFEARFLSDEAAEASSPQHDTPRFSITHAKSGEEGVHLALQSVSEENRFAVAFVDMRMPNGMDGLETTERLWKVDPRLQIVICTAYSDHSWDQVLDRLGYNDRLLLLRKPFAQDEARQMALALSEKWLLEAHQKQKLSELLSEVELRRKAEEELRDIAHRDALTSLPNRPFLIDRLERILGSQHASKRTHDALLFLDLDNFKIINDSLGHEAGDELLNQVANRLKQCVREHDTASRRLKPSSESNRPSDGESPGDKTVRLGGDEFVVLLERLQNSDDALRVARRIVTRICEPFQLGDRFVNIGTSVGIAYIDDTMNDAHDVLRNADTAMYRAKNSGKGQIAVFDKTMHEAVVARHELEAELRIALRDESFELRYQPIVQLSTGLIRGVEVLMRWRGNDGEFVSPSKFIPIAEEIGLISHLGEWVLENSMREFGAMLQTVSPERSNVYLGVNVSRRQIGDPFFADRLYAIMERTKFDAMLKLEMSESGDPRHNHHALQSMLELHESGIGIHIDDFGKGSSSLTCFQSYPVETVKIDRTFTASIARDHGHAIITQSIVQLAHHLNAQIVCQGIESEEQLRLLQEWGCDLGQGYLFAEPLDIDQLKEYLLYGEYSGGVCKIEERPVSTLPLPPVAFDVNHEATP